MHLTLKKIFPSLILPFAILLAFFGAASSTAQTADTVSRLSTQAAWASRPLTDQVEIYQTYIALLECFKSSALKDGNQDNRINPTNATLFQWFNEPGFQGEGTITYLGENLRSGTANVIGMSLSNRSAISCWDARVIRNMLRILGEETSAPILVLCRLGFDRNVKGGQDGSGGGCNPSRITAGDGEGDFYWKGQSRDTQVASFASYFTNKIWGGSTPFLSAPAQYHRYSTLFKLCATRDDDRDPSTITTLMGTDRAYEIYTVNPETGKRSEGKIFHYGKEGTGNVRSHQVVLGGGATKTGDSAGLLAFFGGPGALLPALLSGSLTTAIGGAQLLTGDVSTRLSCAELEKRVNDLSGPYSEFLIDYIDDGGSVAAAVGGADSECVATGTCPGEARSSCVIVGLGWIICPVVNFLAGVADGAFDFLATSFLQTDPKLLSTDGLTFQVWSVVRNLANIVFVIVFLIIIFSQLLSVGISNYGVKKMLPRLVVAAILVNLSFFITQLAVDLSNIAGFSIRSVFDNIQEISTAGTTAVAVSPFDDGEGFAGVAGLVLASVAGAAIVYGLLSTLIPVLIAGVIGLIMIMLILIARQAIIVMLIIVSPLAFVAFLLPNTEGLFKKWRQALTAMLILFPIVALVFGASSLASFIIGTTFSGGLGDDEADNLFGQIIAAAILVLPLFIVPGLLKKSLDSIGNIGPAMRGLGDKIGGGLGKAAGKGFESTRLAKFQQFRKEKRLTDRTLAQAGEYAGTGRIRRAQSALNKKINAKSGKFGENLAASGIGLARESEDKSVRQESTLLRSRLASGAMTGKDLDTQLDGALRSGDRVKTKALQDVMFEQGGSGVDKFAAGVSRAQSGPKPYMSDSSLGALRENITTKHGQMVKSKNAALVKLAGKGGSLSQHIEDPETWAMSSADLATQTGETLGQASAKGLIDPQTAGEMLEDRRLLERLGPTQKAALVAARDSQTREQYLERLKGAPLAGDNSQVASSGGSQSPASSGGSGTPGLTTSSSPFVAGTPAVVSGRRASTGGPVTPTSTQTISVTENSSGGRRVQTSGPAGQPQSIKIDHSADAAPAETVIFNYGGAQQNVTNPQGSPIDLATDIGVDQRETIEVNLPGQSNGVAPTVTNARRAAAPQQSTAPVENPAVENGLYRINSADQPIRPTGTSGNDGAFISKDEKAQIDSRVEDIVRDLPEAPQEDNKPQ